MNNNTDIDIELISRCLSGTASEQDRQLLLGWIHMKRENERIYFTIKDLYDAGSWDMLRNEANTEQEWYLLKDKIKNKPNVRTQIIRFSYQRLLKYAAILLLGVFSAIVVQKIINSSREQRSMIAINTIITGKGERTQVILPDGTKVWLNVCSSISYNRQYGIGERHVVLIGEGFFKVTKNPGIPFIVKANGYDVKALGTTFNVSAYMDDYQVSVVLVEGSISFGSEQSDHRDVIKPGQRISYTASLNKVTIENVDANSYTVWRQGEYRFEHLNFEEIARRLGRIYNVTFVFQNQKMKDIPFTGTFERHESIKSDP
jgi:ferric-dicitrate binding protein FerR (iron transport regulator)